MPSLPPRNHPEDEAATRYPAIAQLTPAISRVRDHFKPSRHVQLNWVINELIAALDAADLPHEARTDATVLISRDVLHRYLDRADTDAYRPRNRKRTSGPSAHSARVRRTVLNHLTRTYGRPVKLDAPRQPPPRTDLPTRAQRAGLWTFVASAHLYATHIVKKRALIRLAAIIGVVLDTGARSGEVTNLRMSDISEDRWYLTLTRAPQNGTEDHQRVRFKLSEKTRNALLYWLTVREELLSHLTGGTPHDPDHGVTALWVTVRAGGRPGRTRRPVHTVGMPLSHASVVERYTHAVDWLNEQRAEDPTWTPIPNTIERLRLSSHPRPAALESSLQEEDTVL